MKISELQSKHGVPQPLVESLLEAGYASLYPPQAEAVRSVQAGASASA